MGPVGSPAIVMSPVEQVGNPAGASLGKQVINRAKSSVCRIPGRAAEHDVAAVGQQTVESNLAKIFS